MITAKKISAPLKLEVLTAIRNLNFEFEQNCEGDVLSGASCKREIETPNFNIAIELIETVRWSSFRDYEFENIELDNLSIINEDVVDYEQEFTDEEILSTVNY